MANSDIIVRMVIGSFFIHEGGHRVDTCSTMVLAVVTRWKEFAMAVVRLLLGGGVVC